jgi:hypothetical protein
MERQGTKFDNEVRRDVSGPRINNSIKRVNKNILQTMAIPKNKGRHI